MPSLPATSPLRSGSVGSAARAAGILGTGAFLPDDRLTNAQLEELVQTSDAWILERTGIRERRRAGSGVTASVMAAEAGRAAMRAAGVDSVDAIVVATCSGDTPVPSTACLVQRRLGLSGVPAFDVNAACTGFIYGLVLAKALIQNGTAGTILVAGSEAMTSLIDYTDRSTCVLFGDGSGAAVVGAQDGGGIIASRWAAEGENSDLIYFGVKPDDINSGDGVRMAGKGTFRLAVERMTEAAEEVLAEAGWDPAGVDVVVPHQANVRIIEAVSKRLGILMSRVVVNVDRLGNTSAASIPIALAEADASNRFRPGDRVLLMAFGAGATWGALALEWTRQPR